MWGMLQILAEGAEELSPRSCERLDDGEAMQSAKIAPVQPLLRFVDSDLKTLQEFSLLRSRSRMLTRFELSFFFAPDIENSLPGCGDNAVRA